MKPTHPPTSQPLHIGAAPPPRPNEGIVIDADGPHWIISCDGQLMKARTAASCLMAPEPGDNVLLHHGEHHAFILAILERIEQGPITLHSPQDLRLKVDGRLQLQSDELNINAVKSSVAIQDVSLLAKQATASIDDLNVVGRFFRRVCEQFSSRSKTSTRIVESADLLQCGSHDCRADQQVSVHAKHVFTSAQGLVRFDGEQIHMG